MLLCPVALFGWNHKPQSKKHRCAVSFFFFFEVFFYFVLFSFFQTEAVERGGGVKPARETVRMVRFGLGPPVHGAHACLCRRRGKWLAGVCWAGTRAWGIACPRLACCRHKYKTSSDLPKFLSWLSPPSLGEGL